jgi:formylglycine-generating enzyme required for sulfatase activity
MKIFISYRRAEDNKSNIVWTIHEKLAQAFGVENVFRDTEAIHGGDRWRPVLEREVKSCKVMVVVIGPDWANLPHPTVKNRLFDEEDVTRWEVETGLRRSREEDVTVIPVRVLGAQTPRKEDLPQSLWQLFDIQWKELQNAHFDVDVKELIDDIRRSRGFREDDIPVEYFEPKTIYIAGGPFKMGSPEREGIPLYETPQHSVDLPSFRIGKYPVTNSQYEEFVAQTQTRVMPIMGWEGQRVPSGLEQHPVTGVTWYEARKYCDWLSQVTGREYSLPNEAQWEKACRGGNNFVYPWGDEFDTSRCNHGKPRLAPVDAYPVQNEYELFDLVGNVRQWTITLWGERPTTPDFKYPWTEKDGRNNLNANSQIRRVVRGSSFADDAQHLRSSARSGQFPENAGFLGTRHGFRVVMKVSDR